MDTSIIKRNIKKAFFLARTVFLKAEDECGR